MVVHPGLSSLLASGGFVHGVDGIFSAQLPSSPSGQNAEREFRDSVAAEQHGGYMTAIALRLMR